MASIEKICLGVSACLQGQAVRFNGGIAKTPARLKEMAEDFELHTFCPEMSAGMGVPREPVRLVNFSKDSSTANLKLVSSDAKFDSPASDLDTKWTAPVLEASQSIVDTIIEKRYRGFIVKSKSPTCGLNSTKQYSPGGFVEGKTHGLFAAKLQEQVLIPVIEAEMLNSAIMADKFIRLVHLADDFFSIDEQISDTTNQSDITNRKYSSRPLIELFADYKLSVMASSPEHYRLAGRLLGTAGKCQSQDDFITLKNQLYVILFDGLNRLSQRGRQTNALMHVMGYFKPHLAANEKQEMVSIIKRYNSGQLPLSVPLALLRHHLMRFPDNYLKRQKYLFPHHEHYGLQNLI